MTTSENPLRASRDLGAQYQEPPTKTPEELKDDYLNFVSSDPDKDFRDLQYKNAMKTRRKSWLWLPHTLLVENMMITRFLFTVLLNLCHGVTLALPFRIRMFIKRGLWKLQPMRVILQNEERANTAEAARVAETHIPKRAQTVADPAQAQTQKIDVFSSQEEMQDEIDRSHQHSDQFDRNARFRKEATD